MWKEVITLEDIVDVALLRFESGCSVNPTALDIKSAIEKKIDCHYYHYKSDTIELVKGLKKMPDHIFILAYTIKADINDYPEALRLMAEKSKEYLQSRDIKKLVIGFGSANETTVNFYNKGIAKLGLTEVVNIAKPIYESLGFKFTYSDKSIEVVL
jgi:hypothetical protein